MSLIPQLHSHVASVNQNQQGFETRSLPTLTRSCPRRFTFYVAEPLSSIRDAFDPIGNVALFAGLTAALTRADRHWTALRACIYATIILLVAMTVGQVIQALAA